MENEIKKIFSLLNDWRKLPNYQLERRIDIFFGLFLEEILELLPLEKSQETLIIPEFPINKRLLNKQNTYHRSIKVDYFIKSNDKIFLLELKTANNSILENQINKMLKAKELGIENLLNGIIEIYKSTKSKEKYKYLLNKLADNDLLTRIQEDYSVKIKQTEYPIEIIYIVPNKKYVKKHSDKILIIDFNSITTLNNLKRNPLGKSFLELISKIMNQER